MQPDDSLPPDVSGPTGSLPPASAPGPAPLVAESRRYTRDGILGKGGMGVVYLAHDHRLGRPVALKEAARAGETAGRLAAEAMITASLDHPGIVTVHDSGVTEDGRPFYTMRLLRGRPLSVVLAERTAAHERLQLVRHYLNACDAVAYAHAEGVVHRDLKPANVMVGGFGETQVVDWGLAARVGAPGEPVGTPGVSPRFGPRHPAVATGASAGMAQSLPTWPPTAPWWSPTPARCAEPTAQAWSTGGRRIPGDGFSTWRSPATDDGSPPAAPVMSPVFGTTPAACAPSWPGMTSGWRAWTFTRTAGYLRREAGTEPPDCGAWTFCFVRRQSSNPPPLPTGGSRWRRP